jgi:hypothetical protein
VSLSAKNDLISNVLTPAIPTSIVVKLVSIVPQTATGGAFTVCNPTAAALAVGTVNLPNTELDGMLAWGITLEPSSPAGTYGPVNVPFIAGDPAAANTSREIADLSTVCAFVQQEGTGFGVCKSCVLGALSGTKQ